MITHLVRNLILFGLLTGSAYAVPKLTYAPILALEPGAAFPSTPVTVTYRRLCNQRFRKVVQQTVDLDGTPVVRIGVIVKSAALGCSHDQPAFTDESLMVTVYSERPFTLAPITPEESGAASVVDLSGASAGNFNE